MVCGWRHETFAQNWWPTRNDKKQQKTANIGKQVLTQRARFFKFPPNHTILERFRPKSGSNHTVLDFQTIRLFSIELQTKNGKKPQKMTKYGKKRFRISSWISGHAFQISGHEFRDKDFRTWISGHGFEDTNQRIS